MEPLAHRIKARREQLKLTQEALADLINKNQRQIWEYETGRRNPTAPVVLALAKALQTSTDYLYGLTNDSDWHWESDDLSGVEVEAIKLLRSQDEEMQRRMIDVWRAMIVQPT